MTYFSTNNEIRRSSFSGDVFTFMIGSASRRRRHSQPKICTFECSNCRKLMLTSVSERNISSIIDANNELKDQTSYPSKT